MGTYYARSGFVFPDGAGAAVPDGGRCLAVRGRVEFAAAELTLGGNAALADGRVVAADGATPFGVGVADESRPWVDARAGFLVDLAGLAVDGGGAEVRARVAVSDDPSDVPAWSDVRPFAELAAAQTATGRYLWLELEADAGAELAAVVLPLEEREDMAQENPDDAGLRELRMCYRARLLTHAPLAQALAHEEAVYRAGAGIPVQAPAVAFDLSAETLDAAGAAAGESGEAGTVATGGAAVRLSGRFTALAGNAEAADVVAGMVRQRLSGFTAVTPAWEIRATRCAAGTDGTLRQLSLRTVSVFALAVRKARMLAVRLSYGTTELTLPLLGNAPRRETVRLQAQGFSAGGTRHVYDSGRARELIVLPLTGLTEAEWMSLVAFHALVSGAGRLFVLHDERGDEHAARFDTPTLSSMPDEFGLHAATLTLALGETR